ncbi:MAG TPA: hypothetical protein VI893_11090, partial [Thermoplasmata archaeon]|nr:hypothetical protein [Thermoplasmata archaeon]
MMRPLPRTVAAVVLLAVLMLPGAIGAGPAGEVDPGRSSAGSGEDGHHDPVPASGSSSSVKSKVLYFHNDTRLIGGANRTQTADSTLGTNQSTACTGGAPCAGSQITLTFYQYPAMADNATVNGSVAAVLWLSSTQGNNMFVDLTLTVSSISPAGASTTHVTSPGTPYDPVTSHFSEYRVATPNATFTVPAGHHLVFEILVRADNSRNVFIAWGDDLYRSRAVVPMETHLRVARAVTLDSNRTAQTSFDPGATTKLVIFNSTVDDPLGGYDVRYANLSLEGPVGSILDRAPMTRGGGAPGGPSAWFELVWNYSGYPVGRYNYTVEAVDNTGFYYRFPSNIGDLTYGGHLESRPGLFYVGSAPVPVHVLAEDSLGAPLPQAVVGVKSAGRYFVDVNRTDAAGRAVLT